MRTSRVDPHEFLLDQQREHAHVQVHQLGCAATRSYVVIGYDDEWNERAPTRITKDGRVLPLEPTDPVA
jgi:hypothetical protein